MTFEIPNLAAVGPEILILGGASAILLVDAFKSNDKEESTLTYWLSLIVLLLASGVSFFNLGENIGPAWNGHFFKDTTIDLLKLLIYLAAFISFIYSRDYSQRRGLYRGEFFILGLFAVLGMSVMISAGSFITIFMGLELLSLPLCTMVALDYRSSVAYEASMRYFVRGAIASGILLYGMSLLYGATGSLNLIQVSEVIQRLVAESLVTESMNQSQILMILGTIFVVVGLPLKFSALPLYILFFSFCQSGKTVIAPSQFVFKIPGKGTLCHENSNCF